MYKLMQRSNQRQLIIAGGIAIVVLLAVVVILSVKYMGLKNDPAAANKEASNSIVERVAKLYLLPQGEEPTVAQIQDKSKLGDQQFFSTAQNGDYVLVYAKAKLAIVYRESANKLVNVGPVNMPASDDAGKDQPTTP